MIRKIFAVLGLLAGGGLAFLLVALVWAHVSIRRVTPPLPALDTIAAAMNAAGGDLPQRISLINTATQPMPRSAVLESARDPSPAAPYVMSFPAFAIQWADGRVLLVDAGMSREEAESFGGLAETFAGADPMRPLGSAAEKLGKTAQRVAGLIFTHLHTDHVEGVGALCDAASRRIRVLMTEQQAAHPNYTTRPGLKLLEKADCVDRQTIGSAGLLPAPGFPGVFVIAAGGHTPGSQIILVRLANGGGYAFTGDIVNNIDGIEHDVPKPVLYRTILVPEAGGRQGELRRYLRRLRSEGGFELLVSHDQRQLERSGVPPWDPPGLH